jgi:integrase
MYPEEWDAQRASIQWGNVDKERHVYLQTVEAGLREDVRQIREGIEYLKKRGPYTVDELAAYYAQRAFNGYLFPFIDYLVCDLNNKNRTKTAAIYASAQRSFSKFRQGEDILLDHIGTHITGAYERYLRIAGLTKNTTSFYMRVLRSIYNQAIKKGLCTQKQPFAEVYTGVDKTVKRAVDREIILRLKRLDLAGHPELELARDLFLFSFYLRGISFIDMANLTTAHLNNGYITYIRSKTRQKLTVKLETCMSEILERYAPQTIDKHLLPIYSANNRNSVSCLRTYNKRLQRLSELLHLETPLSSYVARHSWATLALRQGVPVGIISESMGHENETTTRIYLASLGQSVIDEANERIISLNG